MSRSGYVNDYDDSDYPLACWRGAVASALRGKRGQMFLRAMLTSLDALPEKRLIAGARAWVVANIVEAPSEVRMVGGR